MTHFDIGDVIASAVIGFGVGMIVGGLIERYDWVRCGIKAGVIEYDAITGKPKWKK